MHGKTPAEIVGSGFLHTWKRSEGKKASFQPLADVNGYSFNKLQKVHERGGCCRYHHIIEDNSHKCLKRYLLFTKGVDDKQGPGSHDGVRSNVWTTYNHGIYGTSFRTIFTA